jgi:hypothetical protein
MTDYSRRSFLKTAGIAAGTLASTVCLAEADQTFASTARPAPVVAATSSEEIRKIVSASDLIYSTPVARSEEGIPVGNGRMGSLVWTTRNRLRFQINRVDIYPSNCQSNSFFEAHNDYCGGCAFLDIVFGEDVFPTSGFQQHLFVYDGLLRIEGAGVTIRVVPFMSHDVMAVIIDREKGRAQSVSAVLRMLRYERKYAGAQTEPLVEQHAVRVPHLSHTATSRLVMDGRRILLTQDFREGDFCSKSAVAVAAPSGASEPEILNDMEVALSAAGTETTTFIIASAMTMERDQQAAPMAIRQLDEVIAQGVERLVVETQSWWHEFWSKGLLELHSDDGNADFVQQSYHYYLYLMAATSRGKYPPKFNSMLWSTGGDLRSWGAQHWFTNSSCYYGALPAAGRFELMEPLFDMYSAMLESCEQAARQQWGAKGIYIPETVYFDGIEALPDSIAAEMRELYLMRKPWEQRSAEFMKYAQTKHLYSSRWNWIANGQWKEGRYVIAERGSGPFGPTNHMFNITAKIAYTYWQRYEYTLDRNWLRDRAYPLLRGAVEFYRTFPNLKKGDDGRYHINWVNSGEPIFGARDTMEDTAAMRAITPALLRASEILGIDSEMRPVWQEFLEHLPSIPVSDDPDALHPADYSGPRIFVNGLKPAIKADRTPNGWLPDVNSLSICYFDLCKVETSDRERFAIGEATIERLLHDALQPNAVVGGLSALPAAAASFGKAAAVEILVPNQMRALPTERSQNYKKGGLMANRLTSAEGPQGLSAQHLGRAADALQQSLLQSNPPAPGEDPILHVFPAWPKSWDANYSLVARGAFTVTASMQSGVVRFLELYSEAGSTCRVRNPYSCTVQLYRNGKRAESMRGSLLEFTTMKGERVEIRPQFA